MGRPVIVLVSLHPKARIINIKMNRVLILFFALAVLALSVSASADEETELGEGIPVRHVREAGAAGEGKKRRGQNGKRGSKKRSKKRGIKRKGQGRKQPGKPGTRKVRKHRKMKKTKSTKSTNSSSSCMSNAVKYMKQWKDVVGNFKRQSSRSTKHASVGSKKHGKKGAFAPVGHRLVEVGGDNKSNLSCGGSYDNEGAKQMLNLTKLLFDCEVDVNMSCNPANYPKHNDTMLNVCTNLTADFETEAEKCMKKTIGKTSTSDIAEACSCWEDSSLATMSTGVADCKIQGKQKEITAQKQACTSAFAKCRKYEDEAISVMATCSNTKDKLTAKATTLQTNSDAVTAAVAKMNSLAGTSRRNIRAAAASCAEVITKSTSLTVIISQSTSSSQISVIATEISTSSVTCTDVEKASISSQISSVESALARITEALEAVQEQLTTLTGSTASSGSTSATVSTSAPSLRRDRILKNLLKK